MEAATVTEAKEQSTGEEPRSIDRKESSVPIIRTFIALRQESFGGFMFNPYLPPETRLDRVRFGIATLCNGGHTINEIRRTVGNDLDHTREYVDELVRGTLSQLEKHYALYWRDEKLKNPKVLEQSTRASKIGQEKRQLSAPLFVIWEITGACNLRCKHCLSDSGKPSPNELNTEEAKGLIDTLAEMKVFTINFSGGEPLVRPDIFELLEYASEKSMAMDLLTNGSLITEDTLGSLENTNIFHVQVSLDGLKRTHDDFRGLNGSYDRAVRAIQLLKGANFGVSVSTAVTKQNIDEVPEIVDLAIELGAHHYKTTLFMPAGRGRENAKDLIMGPLDARRFVAMLNEKKEEVGDKISITSEELYPWLSGSSQNGTPGAFEGKDNSRIGCTAGNSSLYITPDGKIAPCPFLRDFIAGDARKQSVPEIWDGAPTFDIFRNIKRSDLKGKCGECEYLGGSCYGGCRAAAFAHSGDLFAEDPLCWKDMA